MIIHSTDREEASVTLTKLDAEIIVVAMEALIAQRRTLLAVEQDVYDQAATLVILLEHPAPNGA